MVLLAVLIPGALVIPLSGSLASVAQGGAASAGRIPLATRTINASSASVSWPIRFFMSFLPGGELRRRDGTRLVRCSRFCAGEIMHAWSRLQMDGSWIV